MATAKKKSSPNPNRKAYVTNAELLEHIKADKAAGNVLSTKLAKCLYMIAERYSYHPWFVNYSFREDMVAAATLNLCQNWHKFDETQYSNPFAYYTTAAYRSFQQFLADERKQRDIRDTLLVEAGANPSFSFQERSRAAVVSDDTAFKPASSTDD